MSTEKKASTIYTYLDVQALAVLVRMLRFKRPHLSRTERAFIEEFLEPIGVQKDAAGNIWKDVGDDPPMVLWSSHTDTCHLGGGKQELRIAADGIVHLEKPTDSSCLGADDTVGVWLMVQMVMAGIPGRYVWHRGEELGRKGSLWIAKSNQDALEGISAAIAFDRYGLDSIITHQMGRRCCSEAFSNSLNAALSGGYISDDGGSYTDTASYMDIVPECTNISVGYYNQHGKSETQDLVHADKLLQKMRSFDVSKLSIERDPKQSEYRHYTYKGPWSRAGDDSFDWEGYYERKRTVPVVVTENGTKVDTSKAKKVSSKSTKEATTTKVSPPASQTDVPSEVEASIGAGFQPGMENWQMAKLVKAYPFEVADYLEHLGIDCKALEAVISEVREHWGYE